MYYLEVQTVYHSDATLGMRWEWVCGGGWGGESGVWGIGSMPTEAICQLQERGGR